MARTRVEEIGAPVFVNAEFTRIYHAWQAQPRRARRTTNAWQAWDAWRNTNVELVAAVHASLTTGGRSCATGASPAG